MFSNTAVSLDGRINTHERRFTSLGSPEDHRRMALRRLEADAVLVGGATFRLWPHASLPAQVGAAPPGSPIGGVERAGRPARGGTAATSWPPAASADAARPTAGASAVKPLWNIVVTRSLDLPLLAGFIAEPRIRPLVLTTAGSMPPGLPVEVERWHGAGDLPVPWMLEQLRRRGIERLLVEAGGTLMYQFLAADAIDEMFVTLCPLAIGGAAPSLVDGAGFAFDAMKRFRLIASEVVGDEVFLRYRAASRPS